MKKLSFSEAGVVCNNASVLTTRSCSCPMANSRVDAISWEDAISPFSELTAALCPTALAASTEPKAPKSTSRPASTTQTCLRSVGFNDTGSFLPLDGVPYVGAPNAH